jgi:hypothetical protein
MPFACPGRAGVDGVGDRGRAARPPVAQRPSEPRPIGGGIPFGHGVGAVTLAMGVAGLSLSGLPADVVYYAQNVWWVLLGTHLYRAGEARVPGPVIREPAAI